MIKVGIIGGSGYTGVELLRLLVGHSEVEVVGFSSREFAGKSVAEVFASMVGQVNLRFCQPDDEVFNTCDCVFFATPHGVAMNTVGGFIERGIKVIDLGADFRITDADEWSKWYEMAHTEPKLLANAVYGLPEIHRAKIKNADLIANPGCYPTAVILGLMPLLKNNLIDHNTIIADCKSGVSGAGRGANQALLFGEVASSFKAYGVAGHRHFPELKQQLEMLAGGQVGLSFVPHLVPMIRGIFATIYVDLIDDNTDVQAVFASAYEDENFVNLLPPSSTPETRNVKASNFCQIAVQKIPNSNKLVILSVIDNLIKGASGQAVQNMNILFNFDENLGLKQIGLLP